MQNTSMILWRKFEQFQHGTDFTAWACGISRLEINNFRRVKGRDRLFFDDSLLQSLASVRLVMSKDLQSGREFVASCLAGLKPGDRDLIHRCYGSQKISAKDVAAELGRPCNTVYKALIRIRRVLLECVERARKASERI
jgi:RNA polymerase sigma-70 factor (ECF subfamily)